MRSSLASLLFKGLATKHTTVKWTIEDVISFLQICHHPYHGKKKQNKTKRNDEKTKHIWTGRQKARNTVSINPMCRFMNERATCYRTLGVQQDDSILSTELIVKSGHRKEFLKMTFRTFALRKSERRNCELSVYMQKMELRYWWEYCNEEENIEWRAFVDTVGIKSANFMYKLLF